MIDLSPSTPDSELPFGVPLYDPDNHLFFPGNRPDSSGVRAGPTHGPGGGRRHRQLAVDGYAVAARPIKLPSGSVKWPTTRSLPLDPKAPSTTYRLELDDRPWTIRTAAGQVHVQPGEPARADASLRADPATVNALLDDPASLDAAMADGSVVAAGDLLALRRLLRAVTNPSPTAV